MTNTLIIFFCAYLISSIDGWLMGMNGCQSGCSPNTFITQPTQAVQYAHPVPQAHYPQPIAYNRPPVQQKYFQYPQPQFPQNNYRQPPNTMYQQTPPSINMYRQPQVHYQRPPEPYHQAPYVAPPAPAYVPPPPKCFKNTSGFKCCNQQLDQFLQDKIKDMGNSKGCNMQRFARQFQLEAQQKFNHSMESIVASGRIENLSRYRGDLYCKRQSHDGKMILMYATSVPYSLDASQVRPMTEQELARQKYPEDYSTIGSSSDHDY